MTLKNDTLCQGGCGKVRSILCSDTPADWICNDCRTKPLTHHETRGQREKNGEYHEQRKRL